MSALVNFSIDLTKLPKDKIIEGKKGGKYINLSASINNETRYGNNVSFYISQTKEQRENKEPREYIGNGKVVWNDGSIENATKEEVTEIQVQAEEVTAIGTFKTVGDSLNENEPDDLPF